jgi:hypothetical protein
VYTVEQLDTTLPDPVSTIKSRGNVRISMGADPDRVIKAYTEQALDDYWMFVVLGDAVASKDRRLTNDATSNLTPGNEYRQQVIFPFSIYVFIPTAETEIAAGAARDKAADLLTIICQSVLGTHFPTGTAGEGGRVNYTDDGLILNNSAFLVHEYNFTQVSDLIFEDTVGPSVDVAFRDIDFQTFIQLEPKTVLSTASVSGAVNLDDEPLS